MATTPLLWKSETQVNTTDSGTSQNLPVVAALGDGGYVVVWSDQSLVHNPNGTAVVAQKYNALGEKVGGEVTISQFFVSGSQSDPAVVAMPDGGFAVAFYSLFNSDYDLYARRFDVNLNLVRTDLIDTTNNFDTNDPDITPFANGSYVITYTAGVTAGGADTDIVARIVSPTGTVGGAFDILNQTDNRTDSQVARLSNGNFVVVFQDEFNGDSTDTDILFRIMTAAAGQVVGPTLVAGAGSTEMEFQPDVAALSGGGFVVVWAEPDAAAGDVHATIYNNAGGVVRSNFLVNTTQSGLQWIPDVLALDDGGFLVSWNDGTAQLLSAQHFNAGGDKVGSEFTVRANAGQHFDVAQLADGRIVYGYDVFSGDTDAFTAIWDPYGPRSGDFNHDVRGDILWQNTNGTVAQWFMNGGAAPATALLAAQPAAWHITGTGDFNQDTTADILWRHDDGTVAIWFMSGAQTIVTQTYGNAPPDWHIQGTADFNGDGKTDILWRQDSGTVGIWHMNGAQIFSTPTFANAPPEWHIQGTGDFNGDGFDDILWRNDNGAVGTWHMAGAVQLSTQAFANQPLDWHIQGTGDFNGDGHDDILWRQDGGTVGIWLMNGAQIIAGPTFGGTGNDWQIEGTGDFNGDGNHDILWRNANGTIATWHMNGAQIVSTATFGAQPADWQVAGMQFDYI